MSRIAALIALLKLLSPEDVSSINPVYLEDQPKKGHVHVQCEQEANGNEFLLQRDFNMDGIIDRDSRWAYHYQKGRLVEVINKEYSRYGKVLERRWNFSSKRLVVLVYDDYKLGKKCETDFNLDGVCFIAERVEGRLAEVKEYLLRSGIPKLQSRTEFLYEDFFDKACKTNSKGRVECGEEVYTRLDFFQ